MKVINKKKGIKEPELIKETSTYSRYKIFANFKYDILKSNLGQWLEWGCGHGIESENETILFIPNINLTIKDLIVQSFILKEMEKELIIKYQLGINLYKLIEKEEVNLDHIINKQEYIGDLLILK